MKTKRIAAEVAAQFSFDKAIIAHEAQCKEEKEKWELAKSNYEIDQKSKNDEVMDLKKSFELAEPLAIEKYVEMVLDNSRYPDGLDHSCDLHFISDRKTLLIDVELPNPDSLPKAIEYKYMPGKDEFSVKEMKKKDFDSFYESVIGQISVRTIHEIFQSVYTNAIDFVTFNGWVNGTDPKTGKEFRNCIISVQAEREYFCSLKLDRVEPIQCLRGLKAQIASEFVNLAPVKPILQLDRNDKRIIASEDIIDTLDSTTNLAMMDWQKFEQLVRDLFEKEFSGEGV